MSSNNELYTNIYCLLAAAWRRRYMLCMPIIIMPILGLLIGIVSPKQYVSHTSIMIQEPAAMNPFLKDFTVETQLKKRFDSLDGILHSRSLLTDVALQLGLINAKSSPAKKEGVIKDLSKSLTMKLIGENLIEITYKTTNAEESAKVLDITTTSFIEKLIAPQLSAASASETFLEKQLKAHKQSLEQAELALSQFKTEHADKLPVLHSSAYDRLAELKKSLTLKKTELAGAQASLDTMKTRLAQTNPIAGKLEEQIVALTSQLAILRARYTDQHSAVQSNLNELNRLEAERDKLKEFTATLDEDDLDRLWHRASSISTNKDSKVQPLLLSQLEQMQKAEAKLLSLTQEVANIKEQINVLEPSYARFGAEEQSFNELQRDLDIKKQLYEKILERYEMARVTDDLNRFEQTERVMVVDPPAVPIAPATPPMILFVFAGLVAGIILGVGGTIILEFADTSIRRRKHLEAITDVKVISRVPFYYEETPNHAGSTSQ